MYTPEMLSEGALRLSLILMAFLLLPANIQMPIEWLQTGRNEQKKRNAFFSLSRQSREIREYKFERQKMSSQPRCHSQFRGIFTKFSLVKSQKDVRRIFHQFVFFCLLACLFVCLLVCLFFHSELNERKTNE